MKLRVLIAISLPLFVMACGGAGGQMNTPASPQPAAPTAAEISILFMGNSHTSVNNIPGMVTAMIRVAKPGKTVAGVEAPGSMHLDVRADDAATLALLQSQRWNYVVLQAQNYSLSGEALYPTTGAEKLVRLSRHSGALPVLFAEWPRVGIDETQIIYGKYVSIAMKEPACVAPIPQAFDLARARFPSMTLHAADGNHSAPAGAFLASLVLFSAITGASVVDLPNIPGFNVDVEAQLRLKGIASEVLQSVPPRLWCPADLPA
ncbi:MAG: hypothetical protein ABL931_11690 [Usitatibacteraceae bacterium]